MTSDEMSSLGIYYHYDESDITNGTALIFGPADTPYANCPLFFSVKVPKDYPFASPIVIMLTSDGITRFHPNLYVNVHRTLLGFHTQYSERLQKYRVPFRQESHDERARLGIV